MPVTRSNPPQDPDHLIALRLIRTSLDERGVPPSRREIAKACGWLSPSSSQDLLRVMEAKGLVRIAPGIPRAVQITEAGMVALVETV